MVGALGFETFLIPHPRSYLTFLYIMKVFNHLLAFATLAHGHYNFPSMIYGGITTTAWADVRQWTGYYTYDPVVDVSIVDIRCNVNGSTAFAPSILSVAAGNTLGFTVSPDIFVSKLSEQSGSPSALFRV